jgi:hypothetical protein
VRDHGPILGMARQARLNLLKQAAPKDHGPL